MYNMHALYISHMVITVVLIVNSAIEPIKLKSDSNVMAYVLYVYTVGLTVINYTYYSEVLI